MFYYLIIIHLKSTSYNLNVVSPVFFHSFFTSSSTCRASIMFLFLLICYLFTVCTLIWNTRQMTQGRARSEKRKLRIKWRRMTWRWSRKRIFLWSATHGGSSVILISVFLTRKGRLWWVCGWREVTARLESFTERAHSPSNSLQLKPKRLKLKISQSDETFSLCDRRVFPSDALTSHLMSLFLIGWDTACWEGKGQPMISCQNIDDWVGSHLFFHQVKIHTYPTLISRVMFDYILIVFPG